MFRNNIHYSKYIIIWIKPNLGFIIFIIQTLECNQNKPFYEQNIILQCMKQHYQLINTMIKNATIRNNGKYLQWWHEEIWLLHQFIYLTYTRSYPKNIEEKTVQSQYDNKQITLLYDVTWTILSDKVKSAVTIYLMS